jgi:hypothetical protein
LSKIYKASVTVPDPTPATLNVTVKGKLHANPGLGRQTPMGTIGTFEVSPVTVIVTWALVNGVAPKVPDTEEPLKV